MKTAALWILLVVTLVVPASTLQSGAPKLAPETVILRVIKVFTAQDGEHQFRAYLVEYKGQEVIVDDRLVKTNLRSDDEITVLVMKHTHPDAKVMHGLLHFSVMPPRAR